MSANLAAALGGEIHAPLKGAAEGGGPVEVTLWGVGSAAGAVVINIAVSRLLRLRLEGTYALAAARCIGQLMMLGAVLRPIFLQDRLWLVALWMAVMYGASTLEAVGRVKLVYSGISLHALGALVAVSISSLVFLLGAVLRVHPLWEPQYSVPLLGMLLGNSLTAVTLAMGGVLSRASSNKARIEAALAMGATRWEALHEHVKEALVTALTPSINMMSVSGLVSIPGMMAGQIIAGNAPDQAARYQIVIILVVAATSMLASVVTALLAASRVCSSCHRMTLGRIRESKGSWTMARAFKAGYTRIRTLVGRGRSGGEGDATAEAEVSRGSGSREPLLGSNGRRAARAEG